MRTFFIVVTSGLALIGAGLIAAGNIAILSETAVTQPEHRFGWTPTLESAQQWRSAPPLKIDGLPEGVTSVGAQVYLWDFEKQINGGEPFPCLRQETGDCTSFGVAGAINTLQARLIAQGAPIQFRQAFPPFIYGVARTAKDIGNGQLGRSAGAVSRWTAEAVTKYGVLPANAPGVPAYSGRLADDWGLRGVPDEFIQLAEPYKVGSFAAIRTYEEARDAIALAGVPVTIASDVGFRMEQDIYKGKRFGKRSGTWNHQMYVKAVDDLAECPDGSRGAVYIMNSWGASAHSPPAGDEPPGGFWVSRKDFQYMLDRRYSECYAYSAFDGFPYEPLNLRIFNSRPAKDLVHFVKQGPGPKYLTEYAGVDHTTGTLAGSSLTLVALSLLVCGLIRRNRRD